jgi:Txe/YoeB family toxin of toxin-antitoxin system
MRNFYLYELALRVNSINDLEDGLQSLNQIIVNRDAQRDRLLCNDTIWECDTTQCRIYDLFGGIVNAELQRIVPFIFRSFTSQANIYNNSQEFDNDFPNDCNGFTGFNFSNTAVERERQIINLTSYHSFVNECRRFGHIADVDEMQENLMALFPNFKFEQRAIEDTLKWKNGNVGLYKRLLALFDDIPVNPFTGGIGETEVLKGMKGLASKRINLEHRVTYRLSEDQFTIHACSGHYDQ